MFRKLTVFIYLLSLSPAAAGAQDLALLVASQPAQRSADSAPARENNLSPPVDRGPVVLMAANDLQGSSAAEEQRPVRTHTGMTFKEFSEVHFGEYRWIYWVGAVAAIIASHAVQ